MKFVIGFLVGIAVAAAMVAVGHDQNSELMPDTMEDLLEEAPNGCFHTEMARRCG
jgi:hypothetical protein